MIDERSILERAAQRFPAEPGIVQRVYHRRDRKRRNERVASAVVALILAAIALTGTVRAFVGTRSHVPTSPTSPTITPRTVGDLRPAWTAQAGGSVQSVGAGDGYVVIAAKGAGGASRIAAFVDACGRPGSQCGPRWTASVTGPASVLVLNNVVYVAGDDLSAFALGCRADGGVCRPLWTAKIAPGIALPPVVDEGRLYVAALGTPRPRPTVGRIFAFSTDCRAVDGVCRPLWTTRVLPNPVVLGSAAGGVVYAGVWPASKDIVTTNTVYAFPAACSSPCEPLWSGRIPQRYASAPVEWDGLLIIGTADDGGNGTLRAYRASCGVEPRCRPLWVVHESAALNLPAPEVANGEIVAYTRFGNQWLRAFPATSGAAPDPSWTACCYGPVSAWGPVVSGDVVFLSSDKGVAAFPVRCGTDNAFCRPLWTSSELRKVAVSGPYVFGAGTDGILRAFRAAPQSGRHRPSTASTAALYTALAAGAAGLLLWRRRRRWAPGLP